MRLLLCLLVIFSPASWAAFQWDNVDRIVVIGDVHGAYSPLVRLLKSDGLINDKLNWSGGKTHLVSLGDLLDRGPESRKVMDLFIRLQQQALESEGYVHVLLGNHEVMNLTGDLRYVSSAEHAALTNLGGHATAFEMAGYYGRWLVSLPFIIRINDTLLAHGGIPRMIADFGIDDSNKAARNALHTILREGDRLRRLGAIPTQTDLMIAASALSPDQQALLSTDFMHGVNSPLLGTSGPLWYRGTAACHALLESESLASTLATLGVVRAVVGHTPTPDREITKRLEGKAYIVDTGMLAAVYKGNARALEIRGDAIRAFGDRGEAGITTQPEADLLAPLQQAEYRTRAGVEGSTIVAFSNTSVIGRFIKLSNRDARRAVAAYRLDRLLGLHMVPTTIQREIDGKHGIVMSWPDNPRTERSRQERGLARPNYCEKGSDFSLLAAFDAMLGQHARSPDNLFYDRNTWQIRITENHLALRNSARLPVYTKQPDLPATMAQAMAGLNMTSLEQHLGDLLKAKEIRALLKRRDAILTWPSNPSTGL